ncbi:hypothetical protein HD553DRAFT_325492 [Filobasidium floriforme]|uniref:uncharacterized protein n=1 Tax=Filobasidium floriforme TaxID=5210 RepID=UPI001E8E26E1|nr:uncharacterized protein HD553DRAFT_325492 [Filobasidium floriforme]KAH8081472.1 hypothetical protein HD553DRAFT_325492 [Filobasidium floriforme]
MESPTCLLLLLLCDTTDGTTMWLSYSPEPSAINKKQIQEGQETNSCPLSVLSGSGSRRSMDRDDQIIQFRALESRGRHSERLSRQEARVRLDLDRQPNLSRSD